MPRAYCPSCQRVVTVVTLCDPRLIAMQSLVEQALQLLREIRGNVPNHDTDTAFAHLTDAQYHLLNLARNTYHDDPS